MYEVSTSTLLGFCEERGLDGRAYQLLYGGDPEYSYLAEEHERVVRQLDWGTCLLHERVQAWNAHQSQGSIVTPSGITPNTRTWRPMSANTDQERNVSI